ncbi:MAG: MBL fold metallo-hydrolase [Thermoplasmata archaeon]|nr:MAG: MBL fold metallo-hydrolase [Thermoplasmata archaeon]KAA0009432.1 MAG: MBL fold metallo-hydrolase [Thermoplasmata archaeon]MCD6573885.1 MBL fold metallo-hydrolase [Thermoplasmata archaeon]
MKIHLLFSDSMGVRSMATLVEAEEKIFIDASAALGPSRYGLPPHPLEIEALENAKEKIAGIAKKCPIHIITHYHYDHYDPSEDFYINKKIFAKRIDSYINASQKERGTLFRERFQDKAEIIYCDDSEYEINGVKLKFSPPFPHGPEGIRLGYVIMVSIEENEKLLFASDVQGPVYEKTRDYIIEEEPSILIMDGPPSYFLGWRFSQENLEKAEKNLIEIMEKLDCQLILDHHLLRDLRYKERMHELYSLYGDRIKTFAEYNGLENNMLEARRRELWEKYEI